MPGLPGKYIRQAIAEGKKTQSLVWKRAHVLWRLDDPSISSNKKRPLSGPFYGKGIRKYSAKVVGSRERNCRIPQNWVQNNCNATGQRSYAAGIKKGCPTNKFVSNYCVGNYKTRPKSKSFGRKRKVVGGCGCKTCKMLGGCGCYRCPTE